MEHEIATVKSVAQFYHTKNNGDLDIKKVSSHHILVLRMSGKVEGQFQDVVRTDCFISIRAVDTPHNKVISGQIPESLPALPVP